MFHSTGTGTGPESRKTVFYDAVVADGPPPPGTTDLGPIVAAAIGLGLTVRSPRVLRAGVNLVVHLAPAPVVVRVATMTAEVRGNAFDYLQRERHVSQALADRGLAVISPTDLVDPGPHRLGDRSMLLLEHHHLAPLDRADPDDAAEAGRALVVLTEALADLPASLAIDLTAGDVGHPWPEIDRLLVTVGPTYESAAVDRIRRFVDELRATEPDDKLRLVHGDAHPGNVARSNGRVVWFDFEDTNLRPLAWDLASLRRSWPAAGDVACRELGVDVTSGTMRWHHELRDVYALLWSMFSAIRHPGTRDQNRTRLADWLQRNP